MRDTIEFDFAIIGRKGSGKSTLAKHIVNTGFDYTRVSFAGPLKEMITSFLLSYGLSLDKVQRMIDGDLKEEIILGLGVTPRHLMQTIGTEWGRAHVCEGVWGKLMCGKLQTLKRKKHNFVCDDSRFDNETSLLEEHGAYVIRVLSNVETSVDTHISEKLPTNSPDIIWLNDVNIPPAFSVDQLNEAVLELEQDNDENLTLVIYDNEFYAVDNDKLDYTAEGITFDQVKELLRDME